MNKLTKKIIITVSVIGGLVSAVIIFLIVSFWIGMTPNKAEEEKVKKQAEEYIESNFEDECEIYDVLYDNMGNFEFEYAAKVRNKTTKTNFLVYFNDNANKMVDTYIAEIWANDLEKNIKPFIEENLEESTNIYVFFDERVGEAFDVDPNNPDDYNYFNVKANIRITIPREKNDEDEKFVERFLSFLKDDAKLQRGAVAMEYIAENGEILDEEFWKGF